MLIIDEIQSGFARTGRMFAIEYSGVEPDLMVVAKSIAGGVPLSAVIGKADIMDAPDPGGLGGTYAGSPLACAAGLAVLEVMREEQLAERALRIGDFMISRLKGAAGALPVHRRCARSGCDGGDGAREEAPRRSAGCGSHAKLVQAAGRRGLIILACGIYSNVIRFLAPLTISDAHLEEGFNLLEQALREVVALGAARRWRPSACESTRSRRRAAPSGV